MKKRVLVLAFAALMMISCASCDKKEEPEEPKYEIYNYNLEDYITVGDYDQVEYETMETSSEMAYYVNYRMSSTVSAFDAQILDKIESTAVKNGDYVIIDYKGTIDGVEFEGGAANDQSLLIGSNTFVGGFEEGVVGHVKGDVFDVKVTFPQTYNNEEVAGKEANFNITLKHIINDDNISEFGYSSIDDLEEEVAQQLYADYVFQKVLSDAKVISYPEDELNSYISWQNTRNAQVAKDNGFEDLEAYLSAAGYTREQYDEQIEESAKESIKQEMVVASISRKSDISLDDSEYNENLELFVAQCGYDTKEELFEQIDEARVRLALDADKVAKYIFESSKIVVPTTTQQTTDTTTAQ